MRPLHDVLLAKPLSEPVVRGVIFFTFELHLAFVLFTVGTAILSLTYYVRSRFGEDPTFEGWDHHFLSSFFVHKSLAIVLGVGPLILMQSANSIPFLTGANLLAPLWMGIIVFLISALVCLELLHERRRPGRWGWLAVGVLGVALLLVVPGTFAAVVTTAERPTLWRSMLVSGEMPRSLALHWLPRVLHVIGAAIVFTAALHLLHGRWPEKRAALTRWIMGGIAFQVPFGVALLLSLPGALGAPGTIALLVGITAAGTALYVFYRAAQRATIPGPRVVALLFATLLTAMLLTRQIAQDRVMVPLARRLRANAELVQTRSQSLGRTHELASYRTVSEVPYDNPLTVYSHSCGFCHGGAGNGQGPEAANLRVPPEDLAAIRAGDAELHRVLVEGIPGTAMPPFTFYTRPRLAELMGFLRSSIGLAATPEALPLEPPAQARADARSIFDSTCATCHGTDGRGSELARGFSPAPPDLTRLTASPERAFAVVTGGYPGTMMPSFASLPEATRWALVEIERSLYRGP